MIRIAAAAFWSELSVVSFKKFCVLEKNRFGLSLSCGRIFCGFQGSRAAEERNPNPGESLTLQQGFSTALLFISAGKCRAVTIIISFWSDFRSSEKGCVKLFPIPRESRGSGSPRQMCHALWALLQRPSIPGPALSGRRESMQVSRALPHR